MINKEHTWTETGGIRLRDDERIDDLQRNHYGIIQRKGAFCFGMDAVLLSGFAAVKKGERALEPGNGNRNHSYSFKRQNRGRTFHRTGNPGGIR